jgi:hypothetical protein
VLRGIGVRLHDGWHWPSLSAGSQLHSKLLHWNPFGPSHKEQSNSRYAQIDECYYSCKELGTENSKGRIRTQSFYRKNIEIYPVIAVESCTQLTGGKRRVLEEALGVFWEDIPNPKHLASKEVSITAIILPPRIQISKFPSKSGSLPKVNLQVSHQKDYFPSHNRWLGTWWSAQKGALRKDFTWW